MIRGSYIKIVFAYIVLVLAQVTVFKDVILFESAFCFIYLLIFLLVSKDTNPLLQLLLGFTTGLLLDSFYNTQGIHAAVSTFIMFIRPFWISMNTPSGGFDMGSKLNVREHSLQWFVMYAFPLIFIHNTLLFLIEASNFSFFWNTLGKAFFSSLFTFVVIVMVQYLFIKKEKY